MQENHLFEYAVIRVVPRVEREEFLNVGVILYCKDFKFLQLKCNLDETRLLALCTKIDIEELNEVIRKSKNNKAAGTSGIPYDFWKKAKEATKGLLLLLINESIEETSTSEA